MRRKIIAEVIRLNLLYSIDPVALGSIREKHKENPESSISLRILRTQLLITALYVGIFALMAMITDFSKQPNTFSQFIGIFFIMTFLQGVLATFNVFYESKDMQSYRHLPVTTAEVIVGKSFTVLTAVMDFVAPMFVFCIFVQLKSENPVRIAIPLGILSFVTMFLAVSCLVFVSVNTLTKTGFFRKHKRFFSALITTVTTVILSLGFLAMNPNFFFYKLLNRSGNIFAPFSPFFELSKDPASPGAWRGIGFWAAFIAVCAVIIYKLILPRFYENILRVEQNAVGKKKKKAGKSKSFGAYMLTYNAGLLEDTTVLSQFILMPQLIMPISMIIVTYNLQDGLRDLHMDARYGIVMFVIGALYAFVTSGMLNSIAISLDRENYNFIKTLPVDMYKYLMYKFWFFYWIQNLLPVVTLTALLLWSDMPVSLIFAAIFSLLLTSLGVCHVYFKRDYKLLDLGWQNIMQLANRGGGNITRMFTWFGALLAGSGLAALAYYVSKAMSKENAMISTVCLAVVMILFSWSHHRSCTRFWKREFRSGKR